MPKKSITTPTKPTTAELIEWLDDWITRYDESDITGVLTNSPNQRMRRAIRAKLIAAEGMNKTIINFMQQDDETDCTELEEAQRQWGQI